MESKPEVPFADAALATRLERAEALSNLRFVEARAELDPAVGAEWMEVAGTFAMFDGVGSPLTQSFGLGLARPVTGQDLQRLESFFAQRGADVIHEASPLADAALPSLLSERGYHPIEFSSVLYRRIDPGFRVAAPRERVTVRTIRAGEEELWAEVAAEGWSDYPELADFILDIGRVSARRVDTISFLAELDGRPIAAGALSLGGGVALLAGASTIPAGRKRGAQLALLESRLRFAAERGCDIAMMAAQPGSASQRNAERQGFRIGYTRIKWRMGTSTG